MRVLSLETLFNVGSSATVSSDYTEQFYLGRAAAGLTETLRTAAVCVRVCEQFAAEAVTSRSAAAAAGQRDIAALCIAVIRLTDVIKCQTSDH